MEILRIKLHIDRKPMRVLAQYIGFLRQLRIYSHESEDEWFRFITHKEGEKIKTNKKIFGVKNPNFNFSDRKIIDLFLGRKYDRFSNRKSVFHSKSFLSNICSGATAGVSPVSPGAQLFLGKIVVIFKNIE